jgi:hypothetical protein
LEGTEQVRCSAMNEIYYSGYMDDRDWDSVPETVAGSGITRL